MRAVLTLAAALVAATIGLSACGSSGNARVGSSSPGTPPRTTGTSSTPSAATSNAGQPATSAQITIKNFSYQVSGPVSPGQKVTVHNEDDVAHTVTAVHHNSLFNVTVQPGQRATFTAPTTPGTYPFGCTFHANMHGKLIVK